MKTKSTKRSLAVSILCFVLCVAMLIGTTYAWFTDSVTSGKNTIVAGNLDIQVTHSNKTVTDEDLTGVTDLFKDVTLWEPGAVAYENITVKNVGSLAAKYELVLNVAAKNSVGGHDLTEVIKVAYVDNGFNGDRDAAKVLTYGALTDYTKTGTLAAESGSETFGVVLYWEPGDNDNLFNLNNENASLDDLFIDLGITIVATQNTVEADSFDATYDTGAILPNIVTSTVVTGQETKLEDTANKVIVTVPADTTSATSLKLYVEEAAQPANIIVSDIQTSQNYEITLKDQGDNKVTTSTLYTATINVGANRDNVMVYHNGDPMTKVETPVNNNEFSYNETTGIVTMKISSFSPFTVTYDKESWADHIGSTTVNVGNITINSAEELAAFAKNVNGGNNYKGYTVTLGKDIDLGAYLWTPIGVEAFEGTFDGNNKIIKNVNAVGEKKVGLFGCVYGGTVKDLIVDGANIQGINAVGTVCGLSYYGYIENCTVKNATVIASVKNNDDGDKVGGVVGRLSVEEGTGSVKGCTAENVTVTGFRQVGGVLGGAYVTSGSYTVTGNTAKDCTIICDATYTYGSYTAMTDVREVIGNNATLNDASTKTNVVVK